MQLVNSRQHTLGAFHTLPLLGPRMRPQLRFHHLCQHTIIIKRPVHVNQHTLVLFLATPLLRPPDASARRRRRPPQQEYIRHLIFERLGEGEKICLAVHSSVI